MDVQTVKSSPRVKVEPLNENQKSTLISIIKQRPSIWSPADRGYLKDAGKWLEVTKKFNEEETTDYTAKQLKELWHSLTTYHNKVKYNSKKLSGAGAEEGATAVKWAHFESMGFLRDKQHQEERYSNLSQIIMEADENEASQPRGSKRGRGDDEGTEITAVLDLMKAHVEKPSFAYKHTIAKNVDDVMDKLENLGLERDKVKLRMSLQRLLDDCELKILDAENND